MRTALLVNAGAREGEARFERAREELVRAGVHLEAAERLAEPGALAARLRTALADGFERIVVGGGDGTLAAAAGVLAGTPAALGVLPLGTANDLARTLGIPRGDLRAAARAFAAGRPRELDVARANGRAFLNAATLGVSSGLRRRARALKRAVGPAAYPAAAAAAAVEVEPFRLTVEVDGAAERLDALQVVVGNGRFHGGGRLVAPSARPDDRRLDLWILPAATGAGVTGAGRVRELLRLARFGALLARGRHLDHEAVRHARATRVRLETAPPLEVEADGEKAGTTPMELWVQAERVTVIAPPGR